jgi:hypothetical protein
MEKLINVICYKDRIQFTNSIQNYCVISDEYDQGGPVGYGATLEKAINSFKLCFDEEIEVNIIKRENYDS